MSKINSSPKPLLVFVHGWAVDQSIFNLLEESLPDFDILKYDLGFYGDAQHPDIPKDRTVIAVGYSLGLLWLLHEKPFQWDGLVSICGFTRFTRTDGFMGGMMTMVLEGMKMRLSIDPKGLLGETYDVCGFDRPFPENYDTRQLHQGLNWLKNWDCRDIFEEHKEKTIALAAVPDPVVSESLTKASFEGKCPTYWSPDGGGHGLPVTRPKWCAEKICEFAEKIADSSN